MVGAKCTLAANSPLDIEMYRQNLRSGEVHKVTAPRLVMVLVTSSAGKNVFQAYHSIRRVQILYIASTYTSGSGLQEHSSSCLELFEVLLCVCVISALENLLSGSMLVSKRLHYEEKPLVTDLYQLIHIALTSRLL